MARPRRDQDYTALFVRIPSAEAEKLHRAADVLGTPKRELITKLVARFDPHDPVWTQELAGPPMPAEAEWAVGRHSFLPTETEVLTPAQLAEQGELPARKLGQEWRFSRSAILAWLGEEQDEE